MHWMSLISFHGMTCSIPLELHHSIGMLIYIYIYICVCVCVCVCVCECVQVNIACAFRGVITSVGVSRLDVAHPLWENISSTGYTSMDDSHSGSRG